MIKNFDNFVEDRQFNQVIKEAEEVLLEAFVLENKEETEELKEARKQILRKYGERSRIRINEKAHLRNSIILGVGNKQLTLEQLKTLFNKVEETRGKTVNGKRWFKENRKYFKESGGTYTLSKLGKRVYNRLLEMDYESKMSKVFNKKFSVNESKVNESKNDNPYQKAEKLADEMFGEFGLFNLDDRELNKIIDLKKADKLADKMFGEFGFKNLSAEEMEELLNANPKLVKESKVNEGKTNKEAEKLVKAWMDMDIMNPNGEEEDLIAFAQKHGKEVIWMAFGVLTQKMKDAEADQYAVALEELFAEYLGEGKKTEKVKEEEEVEDNDDDDEEVVDKDNDDEEDDDDDDDNDDEE